MNESQVFTNAVKRVTQAERAAYLDEACAGNPQLRAAVEALLRAHANDPGFLEQPAVPPGLPGLSTAWELDQVCNAFEAAWRAGGPARIEDHLANIAAEQRTAALRELVLLDAHYRRALGQLPRAEDYRQRFPQLEPAWLARALAEPETRAAPASAAQPLAAVPGYEILQEVGRGGMGVVYQARQLRLNRTVALKVVLAGQHAGSDVLVRFLGEAEAVARLQHPNIVQLFESGAHDGLPYFTLEYVAGGTLAQKLGGVPLPPHEAARMVAQLAGGIAYAHRQGIVHRDLKPANVLLTADGTPKVTDFGLVKRTEVSAELTPTGALLGTPSYMAPEQARGDNKDVGPACDIYALGAVLYECLTGRPPFQAPTYLDIIARVLADEPVAVRQLQPQVPRDLETVCLKCLAKEPGRRYDSAEALAADLQRYLRDEPVQACPPSGWYRLRKFARRNKRGLAAAAVVLVAVLVAASTLGWAVRDWEAREEEADRTLATTGGGVRRALEQGAELRAELRALLKADGWRDLLNQPSHWEAHLKTAQSAVARASVLAAGAQGKLDAALASRITTLDQQLASDGADYRVALRLEKVRLDRATLVEGELDEALAERQYASAFADAGLVLKPGREAEAARRIADSAIKGQLLAALDDWAAVAHVLKQPKLCDQLLAIARQADPDPWRDRLRDPERWRSPQGLVPLAEQARTNRKLLTRLSPQMLELVGRLLPQEHGEAWLREAQGLHPADFWINFTLGNLLVLGKDKARARDALGFYRAALAIRPRNPGVYNNLGVMWWEQKDYPAAVDACNKALALDSRFAFAWMNLGIVRHRQKDYTAAASAFDKALTLDPQLVAAWTNLSGVLRAQKKLPEALEACNKALALDRRSVEAWIHLGITLYEQKKVLAALDACKKALALDGKSAHAWANLGKIYLEQQNFRQAVEACKTALKHDDRQVRAWNLLGVAYLQQQKLAAAEEAYNKALEIDSQDPETWLNLGNLRLAQQDLPAAIAAYKKALAIDPRYALAWNNFGTALSSQNQLPAALTAYRQALDADPQLPQAWNNVGIVLHKQHNLPAAVDAFKKALASDPRVAPTWYNLGVALREQRQLPEAEDAYRQALALDNQLVDAWDALGTVLRDQKKLPEAEAAYKEALAIDGKRANLWYNLGTTLLVQNKLAAAVEAFNKALAIDPKLAVAWSSLGRALREQNNLPAALKAVRQALSLAPLDAETWNILGIIHHRQKDLKGAAEAYQKAVTIDPTHTGAWANLGHTLYLQKNLPEALEAYQKSLALNPRNPQVWNLLGVALREQHKLTAAVAAFHNALAIDRQDAQTWYNLGNALRDQKKLPEAVAAYREALALKPGYAQAWNNIGVTRLEQKDLPAAAEAFQQALRIDARLVQGWYGLGNVRREQQDWPGAVEAYEKALAIDPRYAPAWYGLGVARYEQKNLSAAVDAYRKALAITPEHAPSWEALSVVLRARKDVPAAEAAANKAAACWYSLGWAAYQVKELHVAVDAYTKAIRLNGNHAEAHCNLGHALRDLGDFAGALKALQQGHKLGSQRPEWRYPSAAWVERCERLLALEKKLPAVLQGEPADAVELAALAQLCARYKQRYRDAVLLYNKAFAAERKVADDTRQSHRYDAARAAALAAAGQGADVEPLGDKARALLRDRALAWLRADLTARARQLTQDPLAVIDLETMLRYWQDDVDFLGVRAAAELARLPLQEREAWSRLWAEVAGLRQKARDSYIETRHQGSLTARQRQQLHPMPLSAGSTYVIDLESGAFDAYLRIEDEHGGVLAENDDLAKGRLNSRIVFRPQRDGTYRVVATSNQQRGTGAYVLTIRAFQDKRE